MQKVILRASWRTRILCGVIILIFCAWCLCLPDPLFKDPYSVVLLDHHEELLGARIAADGQWRFPAIGSIPDRFAKAILAFEDKRFYQHPGVDPLALGRALWLNLSHGEVRSGGSTLTMQVIRLSRKGKPRTFAQKIVEVFQATRLEASATKQEILSLYASHAPFGGNVVGLEAASWRYFGRKAMDLSWSEAATLAVLPNAPSLIHPGRNREALRRKRNVLLDKLLANGEIDRLEWELSIAEPIPQTPNRIPQHAPHLLERSKREHGSLGMVTTLDLDLQRRAQDLVAIHHRRLRQNGIHNAAMIVANTQSGSVLAYVGNTDEEGRTHGNHVDVVTAPRSTGSILKPFLYAAMLEEGELLPDMLVADVPSFYGSFSPANYDRRYRGAVAASDALARSLNIPAVRMLYKHGVHRFYGRLKKMGMSSLFRPSTGYGLSLILGGAEGTLWDIAGIYASMARGIEHFRDYNGQYDPSTYRSLVYLKDDVTPAYAPDQFSELSGSTVLGAGASWFTFEAMQEVSRPGEESAWKHFGSSRRVAWKTGTSYGFRDAWSVGVIPGYVVAVWVGNADGEGRPGLIGSEAAAPLMFDMISSLPGNKSWFPKPYDDLDSMIICPESGHRAGEFCPVQEARLVPRKGQETPSCPYHQLIWTTENGFRVHSDCEVLLDWKPDSLFLLPPLQGEYYAREHPSYRPLPPLRHDCRESRPGSHQGISLAYPEQYARIYVPVSLDGHNRGIALEAFHQQKDAVIHWHLNQEFIGSTSGFHQRTVMVPPGEHTLTLIDQSGEELVRQFTVISED